MDEKKYDLEERALNNLKNGIKFLLALPKDYVNVELGKQLVRAAGN